MTTADKNYLHTLVIERREVTLVYAPNVTVKGRMTCRMEPTNGLMYYIVTTDDSTQWHFNEKEVSDGISSPTIYLGI
jgi:hypothetical protein